MVVGEDRQVLPSMMFVGPDVAGSGSVEGLARISPTAWRVRNSPIGR
jgi:hypothetical protein